MISIKAHHISVHFDNMSHVYDVEKVKCKFMVMQNIFVFRKQFPLILAFAVTIHKCQGLSLDCAMMYLLEGGEVDTTVPLNFRLHFCGLG